MVFLYPQTQHPLIPKVDSVASTALAEETKEFRYQFFQTLQTKITELSAKYSESENSELIYRQIRKKLDRDPEVQKIHQRRQILQDLLWQKVATDLECDRDRILKTWESFQNNQQGTIELDANFDYPSHQLKAEIHRMPGGYSQDREESDFWTGATYDHGVFLYGMGWFGGLNDELGQTAIDCVLDNYYQELDPKKILDLGCSVGHSTIPYVTKYPDAEVWGIDVGSSLLKYAHARAEALKKKVHFAQQNAEKTDFKDNSFDLVVSHILLHEIPSGARKKVFAESYRLLKKGGVMIHLESSLFLSPPSMVSRYFRDTEVWVNSEPYLGSSNLKDFLRYSLSAGFTPEEVKTHRVTGYYAKQRGENKSGWIALCGRKR